MRRYQNIEFRTTDSKKHKATTLYPEIAASEQDLYVVSSVGDRFDILANEFYGDQQYWWAIASANPNVRRDTMYIEPGLQLRIPPIRTILERYETLNENR